MCGRFTLTWDEWRRVAEALRIDDDSDVAANYPEPNKPEVTFTIVTCAANAVIGEIHDRMPVILDERAAEDWINLREEDPLSLKWLLVPAPSELLVMQPASPLANSVKNEGPALLEL